jgi:hypothetical protein
MIVNRGTANCPVERGVSEFFAARATEGKQEFGAVLVDGLDHRVAIHRGYNQGKRRRACSNSIALAVKR